LRHVTDKSGVAKNLDRHPTEEIRITKTSKWSTPRIGFQVSSLETCRPTNLNRSRPLPFELKATSSCRSTLNHFASCTIGSRCALSACSWSEFHFSNKLACITSWIRTPKGSLSLNPTVETFFVIKNCPMWRSRSLEHGFCMSLANDVVVTASLIGILVIAAVR
jgi:hypothetical protein